jgi:hypothetical protein
MALSADHPAGKPTAAAYGWLLCALWAAARATASTAGVGSRSDRATIATYAATSTPMTTSERTMLAADPMEYRLGGAAAGPLGVLTGLSSRTWGGAAKPAPLGFSVSSPGGPRDPPSQRCRPHPVHR